jgi:ABC-type lipoprotein release transport system permease subunit
MAGAALGTLLLSLSERRLGPLTGAVGAYAFVAMVLAGSALVATMIPAVRVARVSPMITLSKS